MLPDKTEQHREVASEKYGRSENSDQGKPSRHEAGLVQQQAQQQVAYGRHEALSEEEDAVIEGDKRMTDGERICSRSGLPQGYDRQEECHADEDGTGFQNPGGDEAFLLSDRKSTRLNSSH